MLAQQIIEEAVKRCGIDNQLIVAIEELSELQKELTKQLRGKGNRDHIVEELVDVLIMCEQLVLIFDVSRDERFINRLRKLKRLEERLNDGRCESI